MKVWLIKGIGRPIPRNFIAAPTYQTEQGSYVFPMFLKKKDAKAFLIRLRYSSCCEVVGATVDNVGKDNRRTK